MKSLANTNIRRAFLVAWVIFLPVLVSNAQTERKHIRQGNSKYSDGKFQESEVAYRKAIEKNKQSADPVFNLGDALYRQNKYDEAGRQFQENSQMAPDDIKKSNSYYNLGNSLINSNKIGESIQAYKNSLKLNPGNIEAKYNLAYAQDLLLKQQQQQQQQEQQNQDNKDQDKKNDQNQDKNQDSKDQDKKDQQQQQQQQEQQQQAISKEDAQRILDALANDEKKVQEKVKEAKAARERVKTLINW